jgi:nitric oxide synthase oxygenase domain/subunit
VIKRTEGVTLKRSTFPGYQKPYILLNGKHWFVENLINVSQLADTTIASNLEKIVNHLNMYIFDEKALAVKRSAVIKINEALSELYSLKRTIMIFLISLRTSLKIVTLVFDY